MNFLIDIVLLLILFGVIYWGFNVGSIKMITVIIAMYIGLQVAAFTYTPFANWTGSGALTHQIVWYGVLWVIWTVIFYFMVNQITRTFDLPKALANVDQLVGLALGALAGVFIMMILALVARQMFIIGDISSGGANGLLRSVRIGFADSVLMPILNVFKVVYVNILSPWLPAGQIPLFQELGR